MTVTTRAATKSEAAGGSGGCSLATVVCREHILYSLSLPAAWLLLTPRLLISRLLFKAELSLCCSVLFCLMFSKYLSHRDRQSLRLQIRQSYTDPKKKEKHFWKAFQILLFVFPVTSGFLKAASTLVSVVFTVVCVTGGALAVLPLFSVSQRQPVSLGACTWFSESKQADSESTIFLGVEQAVDSPSPYNISQWSMAGYQLAAGLPESSLHTSMLCAQCQCRQREILGDVYLYCTFLLEGVSTKPWWCICNGWGVLIPSFLWIYQAN